MKQPGYGLDLRFQVPDGYRFTFRQPQTTSDTSGPAPPVWNIVRVWSYQLPPGTQGANPELVAQGNLEAVFENTGAEESRRLFSFLFGLMVGLAGNLFVSIVSRFAL